MAETDWIVGEVMEALKRNGFENNTLVIFTSDNGPEAYGYERIRNMSATNSDKVIELQVLLDRIREEGRSAPLVRGH